MNNLASIYTRVTGHASVDPGGKKSGQHRRCMMP